MCRGLDHDVLVRLQQRVESLTSSVAAGYGCNATVDWRLDTQPVSMTVFNVEDGVDVEERVTNDVGFILGLSGQQFGAVAVLLLGLHHGTWVAVCGVVEHGRHESMDAHCSRALMLHGRIQYTIVVAAFNC